MNRLPREQFRINRRQFLGAVSASSIAFKTAAARRRNVLMIIIDGWRSEMMGCAGNRLLQTPHIDTLAKRSVRFENSFSADSVCMPSRASILTGRYPSVHGVRCNGVPLRKCEVTLARALAENGYETAAVGKLHLEPQQRPDFPGRACLGHSYYGFQEIHLTANRLGPEYLSYVKVNFPMLLGAVRKYQTVPEEATDVYWVTHETLGFLERQRRGTAPFFAYCSFKEMIPPDSPPPPFERLYRPEDMPMPKRRPGELATKPHFYQEVYDHQMTTHYYPSDDGYRQLMVAYYGEVSFIDKEVGRIVDKLQQMGLLEDTMIVLTADHGLCLGDHWIWRHGPWLYDQVVKVPLVIYHPHARGNRVVSNIVESVDIMPTVLDWAGIPIPPGVQGKSLNSILFEGGEPWSKLTAWMDDRGAPELDFNGVSSKGFRVMALRSRDWKYIQYAGKSLGELYDLRNDPGEFENLWRDPKYRHIRNEYRDRLLERIMNGADPLPVQEYTW